MLVKQPADDVSGTQVERQAGGGGVVGVADGVEVVRVGEGEREVVLVEVVVRVRRRGRTTCSRSPSRRRPRTQMPPSARSKPKPPWTRWRVSLNLVAGRHHVERGGRGAADDVGGVAGGDRQRRRDGGADVGLGVDDPDADVLGRRLVEQRHARRRLGGVRRRAPAARRRSPAGRNPRIAIDRGAGLSCNRSLRRRFRSRRWRLRGWPGRAPRPPAPAPRRRAA